MTNEELIILIDELRALPKENEWVEFKTGTATTNDRLGQYISAISNAACIHNQDFGYLVFGIHDDIHEVVGTAFKFKNKKEGNQELELYIRQYLHPSIRFAHFTCQYGTYHVEIFKIPAAKSQPTNFKKIPYIRFDTSLTDLRNYSEYARVIYNSEEDWSAQVIEKATLDALDPIAILKAKEKFKEKKAGTSLYTEVDKWDTATFLDKAKITVEGKITKTAILLLGKPESVHYISPAVCQITWKLESGEEKAYQHFEAPLFTSVNDVLARIRNVKFKFFPNNQLIATEVLKYDSEVILEALNNCIAHQDYGLHSRIILTEKSGKLIFSSAGSFFDGTADDYTLGIKTPKKYRNKWLTEAMVNLGMIDSLGYGIHKMYKSQWERYFPLPDYTHSTRDNVVLEIYGQNIDENYAKLLIEKKDDLNLTEVILLDKVQKKISINDEAFKLLKKRGLIEGRKPNYYISLKIAELTNQKAGYIRNRGFKDEYYKKMILEYLEKYERATKEDIDKLILDILPDILDIQQRANKVRNLLYAMSKKEQVIVNQGTNRNPIWKKV